MVSYSSLALFVSNIARCQKDGSCMVSASPLVKARQAFGEFMNWTLIDTSTDNDERTKRARGVGSELLEVGQTRDSRHSRPHITHGDYLSLRG